MLVLLNFWRNHLVLCLENLLPSPLCWREKLWFHPCMLKTSKSIPAYYCASNYRLRVHKIFTSFLLLSIIICHKLCFREESAWSLQICSNYSIWMSQCVENSSSQLILLSSKLFSAVSTLFIPCCISCVLFTSFVSNHCTLLQWTHIIQQTGKVWLQEALMAFPGQFKLQRCALSFWLLCLSLKCDKSRSLGERQGDVLIKPLLSFVCDKPFYKDQLYTHRSGNRHSKERQANSFSIEWDMDFSPALKHTAWWACSS